MILNQPATITECDNDEKLIQSHDARQQQQHPTDRPDLRQVSHVRRLNLFISRSLRAELAKTHRAGDSFDSQATSLNVYETLIGKISHLREISLLHMGALTRFRRMSPEIEFPALHRELFSIDSMTD